MKEQQMQTRPIPSSGEALPVIGCGTYVGFEVGADSEKLKALAEVVRTLRDAGGKVFDSSPMYGRAEAVLGDLLAAAPDPAAHLHRHQGVDARAAGRHHADGALVRAAQGPAHRPHAGAQPARLADASARRCGSWKQDGRIRYLGVTHYTASAYDELEAVMRKETLDFVQLNYSLDDRAAERKLLPLAAERGIAHPGQRPVRRRWSFAAPGQPAAAGLGRRDRLHELAPNPVEVRSRSAGGYVRDPRHGKSSAYG
jgi:diketogulonate reductase-like aldo/keto reductase